MSQNNMLAYVANAKNYGPILLDDLVYTDQIPMGSPLPVPGATTADTGVSGVSVVVNEGNQVANVNTFPATYSNKLYNCIILDLGVAAAQKTFNVQGTMLWAVWGDNGNYPAGVDAVAGSAPSADSAAMAFLQINDASADLIPVAGGFSLSGFPFHKLFFSWQAQAGKKLIIFISADAPLDRADLSN